MENRKPGCLVGIFQLLLLDRLYKWLQKTFGYQSGSCIGCGCGTILLVLFIMVIISIIFGTDWFRLF